MLPFEKKGKSPFLILFALTLIVCILLCCLMRSMIDMNMNESSV